MGAMTGGFPSQAQPVYTQSAPASQPIPCGLQRVGSNARCTMGFCRVSETPAGPVLAALGRVAPGCLSARGGRGSRSPPGLPDRLAASPARLDVDLEHTLQALCPSHGCPPFGGRVLLHGLSEFGFLALAP